MKKGRTRELPSALSSCEREVMLLVRKGLTNKEIAQQLNLPEASVKVHLHNVFNNMAMRNRAALAELAAEKAEKKEQQNEKDR